MATLLLSGISAFIMVVLLTGSLAFTQAAQMSADDQSLIMLFAQAATWVVSMPFWVIGQLFTVLLSAVPAVYFSSGSVVTPGEAFRLVWRRPWRYIFAGAVFSIAVTIGFVFCVVPAFVVGLVGPVFMNKIFTSDMEVMQAFSSSFSDVYKSDQCWPFIGIQIVVTLIGIFPCLFCVLPASMAIAILPLISIPAYILSVLVLYCCGIPAASFYVQNMAYHRGILS